MCILAPYQENTNGKNTSGQNNNGQYTSRQNNNGQNTCGQNNNFQNNNGQNQNTTGRLSMPDLGVHCGPLSEEY